MAENVHKVSRIRNSCCGRKIRKKLIYHKINNVKQIVKLNKIAQMKENQDIVKREHQRKKYLIMIFNFK